MALNQEELEKLKGLSKEDKENLIKALSESDVEESKVTETEPEHKEPEKEPEKEIKVETPIKEVKKEVEKPKEEPKKEPETETGGSNGNSWEEAIKRLQKESNEKIANLEKELAEVKKRQPKGFEPQPQPKGEELENETEKRKKMLSNRFY